MGSSASSKLDRGERVPDFVLPSDGHLKRFYGLAGGAPLALVFVPRNGDATAEALVTALAARLKTIVVKRHASGRALDDADTFVDEDGRVSEACGVNDSRGRVIVLDANLRVLEAFEPNAPAASAARALELVAASEPSPDEARCVVSQAPVLLVPRALELETCSELIEVWSTAGNEETGVEAAVSKGRANLVRHDLKRRRDHTVQDPSLIMKLARTLGRRLIPEVRRAFVSHANRFEGFKIVRYDAASGGFFRAHRDNLSPTTAHRRFALTLNLGGDYEGGELRFPEYGPMTYRPATGEALLFSCSLLHEVTDVTKGERFALISFLFGETTGKAADSSVSGAGR